MLGLHAYSINKVCLATARRSVDVEGVEGRLAWMLGDGQAYGARQLVGVALYEVVEGLFAVELRVDVLRHSGIEDGRGLVGACCRQRSFDVGRALALPLLLYTVRLIRHQTVGEPHVRLEAVGQCPSHQAHVVLFQVLVDIRAWNLHQQRLLFLVVGLEDDGLEPRFKDLLCDVLLDEMEAVVPKRLMTLLHLRR